MALQDPPALQANDRQRSKRFGRHDALVPTRRHRSRADSMNVASSSTPFSKSPRPF
jgi:hypothetical protein